MKSTDKVRTVTLANTLLELGQYTQVRTADVPRYKAPKGRAVTKAERPTYDRAHAACLAGAIQSWHIYEDGWTFTVAGVETAAMTLVDASEFLDGYLAAAA